MVPWDTDRATAAFLPREPGATRFLVCPLLAFQGFPTHMMLTRKGEARGESPQEPREPWGVLAPRALSPRSPRALSTPGFPRSLEHTEFTREALPSPHQLSSRSLDGPSALSSLPWKPALPLTALLAGHEVVLPSVGSWCIGPGLWRGRPVGARMMTVTFMALSLVPDPLPGTGGPSGTP